MKESANSRGTRALIWVVLIACFAIGLESLVLKTFTRGKTSSPWEISRKNLRSWFAKEGGLLQFPAKIHTQEKIPRELNVDYTIDENLQTYLEKLIRSYRPDYAAFVAMDPATGKVLSLISYSHEKELQNLTLRADFPSASVFKMVTAAAAIGERNFAADSVMNVQGRGTTLYKYQIFGGRPFAWGREMSLKEAFAHSVNSAFGKIGVHSVGKNTLQDYANRFGFNREWDTDIPVSYGVAHVPDDQWKLAETSSGFTKENKMSPVQGAAMAAIVANDGVWRDPYFVNSMHDETGKLVYEASPSQGQQVIDTRTAIQLKELMQETVLSGTSKSAYRRFFRGRLSSLEVGGKTGSLTGESIKGKHDWFVGYANDGMRKISVAALTIHYDLWRVKSSLLARYAFEHYFSRADLANHSHATREPGKASQ